MQNAFLPKDNRNSVDLTPLKMLFAVLAVALVGILNDVSAMAPLPALFRPPFSKIKEELGQCPSAFANTRCDEDEASRTSCFLAQNGSPSGPGLCTFPGRAVKPARP